MYDDLLKLTIPEGVTLVGFADDVTVVIVRNIFSTSMKEISR